MAKANFQNSARGAFTLIEILVVLVIMGFLVSMVAPKLAGITDRAIDVTCDTNQKRLRNVMAEWTKMNSKLPAPLTNLVFSTHTNPGQAYAGGDAILPSVSDDDKTNGPEVLSSEFAERWLPMIHHLNEDEATEFKDLVGAQVVNYGLVDSATIADTDSDGFADTATVTILENNFQDKVKNTLPVMMIGAGFSQAGTPVYATGARVDVNSSTITVDGNVATSTKAAAGAEQLTNGASHTATVKSYARIAEAPMALRILVGLSNSNGLVTSGILDESGVCPGQVSAEDQFEYGSYALILPRLQATADRFLADGALESDANKDDSGVVAHAVNFNENDDGKFTLGARTPFSPKISGVNLGGQDIEAVTTSCPEGHTWGAIADWFGVSLAKGEGVTVK